MDFEETLPPPIPAAEYINTPHMQSMLAQADATAATNKKIAPQKEMEKEAQVG